MQSTKSNKKKQSIIVGALTGSAGVFFTKAIGLLYVIPFKKIAIGNTVFYSYAYTIYDYVLQICLSGLPFAVAALVAKYMAKDDYATVRLVRKVSKAIMLLFGLVCCAALIIFARPFAYLVIPEGVSEDYIIKTQTVLVIVAFALIAVPLLSYYRGVYQGLKQMKTYAFTQVLEQIVRVTFLLGASCICVYLLKMDRVWAAYMGVASTSISAIITIIYFMFYDRRFTKELASSNMPSTSTKGEIFKELMGYAIPYLLSAIISNSSGLFILLMLSSGLQAYGVDPYLITTYQGIINYEANKITSIPQVIATGFSLALIPHITEELTKGNIDGVNKLIQKALETVNYLAVPLVMFMVFFAKEIYFIMYGNTNLDIGASILSKSLLIQMLWIVVMVLSSIMVALKMRKAFVVLSISQLIFVLTTLLFWLGNFGINGYYICKTVEYLMFIIGAAIMIENHYKASFKTIFNNSSYAWVACLPMLIIVAILSQFTFDVTNQYRIIALLYTGVLFLLSFGLYFFITAKFSIPQRLFNAEISPEAINKLISRKNKRTI